MSHDNAVVRRKRLVHIGVRQARAKIKSPKMAGPSLVSVASIMVEDARIGAHGKLEAGQRVPREHGGLPRARGLLVLQCMRLLGRMD